MFITKEYLNNINYKTNSKYSKRLYLFFKKNLNKDIKVFKNILNNNESIFWFGNFTLIENKKVWKITSLTKIINIYSSMEEKIFQEDKGYEFIELPNWLEEYKQIGRCIYIDHNQKWILNNTNTLLCSDRFVNINNQKKCNWCGKIQAN